MGAVSHEHDPTSARVPHGICLVRRASTPSSRPVLSFFTLIRPASLESVLAFPASSASSVSSSEKVVVTIYHSPSSSAARKPSLFAHILSVICR